LVKHIYRAELRIVAAAVPAAAADAVFVANHLPKLAPIWLPPWAAFCEQSRGEK
jgi:hypothetical protein